MYLNSGLQSFCQSKLENINIRLMIVLGRTETIYVDSTRHICLSFAFFSISFQVFPSFFHLSFYHSAPGHFKPKGLNLSYDVISILHSLYYFTVDVHELGLLLIKIQAYTLICVIQSCGFVLHVVPVA